MKRILLINPFDSLPGENQREHRYTILYNKLKKVSDVIWISSTYQHYTHNQRSNRILSCEDRERIILVPMLSYKKNISVKRFLSYLLFSWRTLLTVRGLKRKPDTIVCWGPVELIFFISVYARFKRITLIIDVVDLWPDLFVLAFPEKVRFIGRVLLQPFFVMSRKSFSSATHITSVSKTYTTWALRRGGRNDSQNSSFYYLGCNTSLADYNRAKSSVRLRCLFAGQFSFNYDVETIIAVARRLSDNKIGNIEFILAGDGYKKKSLASAAAGLGNVVFTGWLASQDLNKIASECHIGLCSYTQEATQSLPNKVFDYMSMGLFILNSLNGESKEFITSHHIGEYYEAMNRDDLYNKIIALSSMIPDVINVGRHSLSLFKKKFQSDIIYDNMIDDLILKNEKNI